MQRKMSLTWADSGDGSSSLEDASCGRCLSCRVGATLWCDRPVDAGRPLGSPVPTQAAARLLRAVLSAAALSEAPTTRTVLVLAPLESATVLLARSVAAGAVFAATSPADPAVRAELAVCESSGRAPVVVAGDDVRTAVRAVRRGGHVCVPAVAPAGDAELPSVTELVQREVTLLGPRRVAQLVEELPRGDWAAAVAAAAA